MSGPDSQRGFCGGWAILLASTLICLSLSLACSNKANNVVIAKEVQIAPQLKERVVRFWQARIANDLDKTYDQESPKLRQGLKLQDYKDRHGHDVVYQKAEISHVTVEGDQAQVRLKLDFRLLAPVPGIEGKSQYVWVTDYWEKVNGQWYHVQKDWMPTESQ